MFGVSGTVIKMGKTSMALKERNLDACIAYSITAGKSHVD